MGRSGWSWMEAGRRREDETVFFRMSRRRRKIGGSENLLTGREVGALLNYGRKRRHFRICIFRISYHHVACRVNWTIVGAWQRTSWWRIRSGGRVNCEGGKRFENQESISFWIFLFLLQFNYTEIWLAVVSGIWRGREANGRLIFGFSILWTRLNVIPIGSCAVVWIKISIAREPSGVRRTGRAFGKADFCQNIAEQTFCHLLLFSACWKTKRLGIVLLLCLRTDVRWIQTKLGYWLLLTLL